MILFFSVQTHADTLRFVAEELPPYHFHNQDGKIDGALVDVVKALVKKANLQAEIELMPMARAVHELGHEKNTLMFSLLKTKDREDKYQFLGATFHASAYLFGLKSTPITLTKLKDAERYRVSTIRGYHSADYLLENEFSEDSNLILSTEYQRMWQMLYLNRVDLVMTNALSIIREIRDSGLDPALIEPKLTLDDFPSELHLAANRKIDSDVAIKLANALKTLKANGDYDAILAKWQLH
jgi:polar amino acid transport system substrate-binding protein